ncbi:MAG: alpha-galactosidase [Pirellulaceae bacterium]
MSFSTLLLPSMVALSVLSTTQDQEKPGAPVWPGAVLMEHAARHLPAPPSLELIRQSYFDRLGLRRSLLDTPLTLRDKVFQRGINTYGESEIRVRLSSPGETFSAEIGIDNNFQTKGQLGSAVFVVDVGGKEVFRSSVLRGSDAPVSIAVDLGGASEFALRVLDAGDGINYDEADWADASVTLVNGKHLWLDEFAVTGPRPVYADDFPFSFIYGGKPSSALIPQWNQTHERKAGGDGREIHLVTYTDPASGLQVMVETTVFAGRPAVEWVLRLRNLGSADTQLIEDIRPLNIRVEVHPNSSIALHRSHGSDAISTDFIPLSDSLAHNAKIEIAPVNGRSSDTNMPFFNLEWADGGVLGAIGWTGQWAMQFERDGGGGITLRAGQQTTHLKLHPGESIRTPRILLVGWQGKDRLRGHNTLRQLLVDYYLPRLDGEVVVAPITQNSWFTYSTGNGATEENQLELLEKAAAIGAECYWLDAGWFEGGWPNVGTWSPRTDAFPNGLKPLGDAAHRKGMKFVLWFEPERVSPASQIAREHPEWVMHVPEKDRQLGIQDLGENELFHLGNPEARAWMTDFISKCISDWGVDIYRQDFNIFGTLRFWQAADAPDRQGMAENLHVQGLYAFWDELLRRHPGLIIDNCASGGRRIDLETLSRSVPLWRSDSQCCGKPMPAQDQAQTAGLSLYVPIQSAAVWTFEPYGWRSVATTGANISLDHRPSDFVSDDARKVIQETKDLRALYLGDYYPLTEINTDEKQWCGWQFNRPDLGRGLATFFRRAACPYAAMDCHLRGLDPLERYEVTFVDTEEHHVMSGAELSDLRVTVNTMPGTMLVTYRKVTK